uniref:Crossover junction endonuclease EME1 n=2 Tax=Lygus hesperus TaxID=30085 RepID=A0A0A9Y4C6_LYGHE
MKPGECMKYITVVVDQNIASEYPWGPSVVEILQTAGIKCSVEVATDPCTVKWRREQADSLVPQQEKHVLFLWSTEKLLTSVQYGTLSDSFAEFKKKYENFKLYLCVYGLQNYYRKFHKAKQRQNSSSSPPQRKRKSNYEIIPDQLEMELIALQIKFGISHKILNSAQETAFFLQVITKSVAEMPFKLEKEKVEMERNWYAKGDSKKCVRIDKDFNGLRQLWLQQLSQFNLSSLDIAKSIAELYPTPLILYHAYRQCSSSKEKETMLQDIVVKRGPGGGGRRLGPELSRKISILFCQDEDIPLD